MSLTQKGGCSRERCSLPSYGPNDPSSLTAHKGSSILGTQRQPCRHLTGVPRHDPEETQDSDAIQCRARASWHLGRPDGRHILLPRKAFQGTVCGSKKSWARANVLVPTLKARPAPRCPTNKSQDALEILAVTGRSLAVTLDCSTQFPIVPSCPRCGPLDLVSLPVKLDFP